VKKKKSIREVIKRGQICVSLPAFPITFFPIIFALNFEDWFLSAPLDIHIALRISTYIFAFFVGIPFAWLYWSFTIPKWRVWAKKNVKSSEWEDLLFAAIDGNLIWPPGHPAERTEIRTKTEQKEIEEFYAHIYKNIKRENILGSYTDKADVPIETYYYFSNMKVNLALLFSLLSILLLVWVIFSGANIIVILSGLVFAGYSVFYLISSNIRYYFTKKKPRIILSDKGISIRQKELSFYPWKNIDYIKWEETIRSIVIVIENENQKDEEFTEITLNLELLNVSHREFLQRAKVYMGRFDRNNLAPLN